MYTSQSGDLLWCQRPCHSGNDSMIWQVDSRGGSGSVFGFPYIEYQCICSDTNVVPHRTEMCSYVLEVPKQRLFAVTTSQTAAVIFIF